MFNFLPFASRNGVLYDILLAGGAGSGGAGVQYTKGGGGSAGWLIIAQQVPLRDFGASFAVVIGLATSVNNQDGNPSSFGNIFYCNGGKAGAFSTIVGTVVTPNPGSPSVADNSFYGSGASGGNIVGSRASGGVGFRFGGVGGTFLTKTSAMPLEQASGAGGGGAGAGGNGGSGTDFIGSASTGGTAGAGILSSISGSPVTYCAGGAGGGNSASVNAGDGATNTGSGGGGAHSDNATRTSGVGAAGVCIVRYAVGAPAATGGTITTDATYRYHRFTSNGTFALP